MAGFEDKCPPGYRWMNKPCPSGLVCTTEYRPACYNEAGALYSAAKPTMPGFSIAQFASRSAAPSSPKYLLIGAAVAAAIVVYLRKR